MALGFSLIGVIIESIVRSGDNKPKIAQKYFLIFFVPSVIGGFLLFGIADHLCVYLKLYKSTNDNSSLFESTTTKNAETPTYTRRKFTESSPMRSKLPSEVSNDGSLSGLSKSRSETGTGVASFGKLGNWGN